MSERILITGGAGFIGSHLADRLLSAGYAVRALDCLASQVHGPEPGRPAYLDGEVELHVGDVRDAEAVRRALRGVDAVVHFAAAVGVGQSMYEIAHYTSVNNLGTAVLLEQLAKRPVRQLLVASSMSVYGEGLYRRRDGSLVAAAERGIEQLKRSQWELCDERGEPLEPVPTPETKPLAASSVYALSKYDQERLCLIVGAAYGIATVAMRFFNVYGPRQALSNPYTGVMAIFASRLLSGQAPLVFEDGRQQRDFVNVRDVARACWLALETPQAAGQVFNIGSGQRISVRQVADEMRAALGDRLGEAPIEPEITGKHRVGDIRHCFADISKATRVLGYEPQVSFREGLIELARWLEGQMFTDRTSAARQELAERGLVV